MKNFFKKLKGFCSSSIIGLLFLVFTNQAKAQHAVAMYGVIRPTPREILGGLFPYIAGVFLIFVAAPIVGLIWYRKHEGIKKRPNVVVWALVTVFVMVLAALLVLIYLKL